MDKYMYASVFCTHMLNGIRVRKKELRKDNMDKKDKDKKRHKCRARKKEEDKEKERGRKKMKESREKTEGGNRGKERERSFVRPPNPSRALLLRVCDTGRVGGWLAGRMKSMAQAVRAPPPR